MRPISVMNRAVIVCLMVLGCGRLPSPTDEAMTAVGRELDGLHNVYEWPKPSIFSGSGPESETAFRSLSQLGIKTIVSVDGAKPDVAMAGKFGIRYVHLPIGYDGISAERAAQLARAASSLPRPIYVHCHHGKHRGPAAVAVMLSSLDPNWPVEQAQRWLKAAGTDPKYFGLYAVRRVSPAERDACPADFPETASVPDLARLMVEIDQRWDHLKAIEKEKWGVPAGHPDLVPATEAVLLAEAYREAGRLKASLDRGAKFIELLKSAERDADELARAIGTKGDPQPAFERSRPWCTTCHTSFRDKPGP
jgi:protein tyrosine phosphatase (PTP) superfamily phosphohydrolase (DUF442 family)